MSRRQGPPVHQNKHAWKPNANVKINESEVGSKQRPFSEVTGVCARCKDQIDWKRRYGKYKPIVEPAKCQKCGKRAVRQAHHKVCLGCSKSLGICAKCCCQVDKTVGRDISEVEAEEKALDEAVKNARERDRRRLLREMNKGSTGGTTAPTILQNRKVGEIFPVKSLEEYVDLVRKEHPSDDITFVQ